MMRRCLVFVVALVLTSISFASDNTADFRKILAAQGFFGSASGESWPYPGGFLVMRKGGGVLTFIDAPDGKPQKDDILDAAKSFPKIEQHSKTTLSVVLQGLEAIIGGNPGFGVGHSGDLTFAQLDGNGSRITYKLADKQVNAKTAPAIDAWMKSGHKVFVVGVALTTKSISVSTDKSTNIDATWNGTTASDCSKDDKNKSNNSNGNSNGKPNSSDNATPTSPQTFVIRSASMTSSFVAQSDANQSQGNPSQGGTANSKKPGGDFHFCKEASNKITLTATTPLVFALGAYEVVNTDPLAPYHLEPVMGVPKQSGPFDKLEIEPGTRGGPAEQEMTKPNAEVAGSSEPQWKHLSWKNRGKLE